MSVNTFVANGGEWNTATNWLLDDLVTQRVPITTDDCVFTGITAGNSGLSLIGTNAWCKSVDFSTAGAVFTFSGTASYFIMSGSLILKSGMTFSYSGELNVARAGSGSLSSNGVSLASIALLNGGYNGGTLTLLDALNLGTKNLDLYKNATLITGNYNITCGVLSDNNQPLAVTLTLGSSTINCTGLSFAVATLTVTANTANITCSGTGTSNFGGQTWGGSVTFTGNGATLAGNNTFTTLNVNTAGLATGLIVTVDSIQTVTNFATNGYASNLAKILSSLADSHFHLSKAGGGQVSVDYMSIKDSVADQANTWYAGANSTDVSGNSGWVFTAPPAPAGPATLKTWGPVAKAAIKTIDGIPLANIKTWGTVT